MSRGRGFSKAERSLLSRLSSPERIQRFLDEEVGYNAEHEGETCRSPRRVLRERVAHCAEGAFLAASALGFHGRRPLVLQIRAFRDTDHVLALYTEADGRGGRAWGAVAKSNFSGLRFRTAVYRSIRELVMSYFDHYYNFAGDRSLRSYTDPVNLARFDARSWETDEKDLWDVSAYLSTRRLHAVLTGRQERRLVRLDTRLYFAGLLGASGVTIRHPWSAREAPRLPRRAR